MGTTSSTQVRARRTVGEAMDELAQLHAQLGPQRIASLGIDASEELADYAQDVRATCAHEWDRVDQRGMRGCGLCGVVAPLHRSAS